MNQLLNDDYDAQTNTSDVELETWKIFVNIEGEENNKLLDEEDTQRTNLNSKYVNLTLVLNILIL